MGASGSNPEKKKNEQIPASKTDTNPEGMSAAPAQGGSPAAGRAEEKQDIKKPASHPHYPPNWVLDDKFLDKLGNSGEKKDYKMLRRIGQPGAFGEAKIAENSKYGKVAIKEIHKSKFCRSARRAKYFFKAFRSEIKVLQEMNHPGVIRYLDVFEDQENLYIVMELCTGGELYDRLIEHEYGYSEKEAAEILKQLFTALAYIHKQGIVHCDLKPDNFLFKDPSETSQIKIIDFGMAKHVTANEYYHRQCGTFYYKAPEVLFESGYNTPADIWSMGVIMYAVLYGTLPFRSHNRDPRAKVREVERLIAKGFDPKLKEGEGPWFDSRNNVSEHARNLIAQLLQKDPEKRPTAEEVLQHAWFNSPSTTKLSPLVKKSLKEFHNHNMLKDIVLEQMMQKGLTKQEKDELRAAFQKLDTKGEGVVRVRQLQDVLYRHRISVSEADIKRMRDAAGQDGKSGAGQDAGADEASRARAASLFKGVDLAHDEFVSYRELLAAYTDSKISARQERLYKAFHNMQHHHPERDEITLDDIMDLLKEMGHADDDLGREVKHLFEHFAGAKGSLDYKGFAKMWYGEEARSKLVELHSPKHHKNE